MSALRLFAVTAAVMASVQLTTAKAVHTTTPSNEYASSTYVSAPPTATGYPVYDGNGTAPALYIDYCYPLDLLPVYVENTTYLPFYLAPFNQTGYLIGYSINGVNSTTGSNVTWTDGPTATTYPDGGWATTYSIGPIATTYSLPPGEDYPASGTFAVGFASSVHSGAPVTQSAPAVSSSTSSRPVYTVTSISSGSPVTQSAPQSSSGYTVSASSGGPVTQSVPAGGSSGSIYTFTVSAGPAIATTLANGSTVTYPVPSGNGSVPIDAPSPIELPFPVPSNVSYPPSGYACFHLLETNTTGCIAFCGVQSPGVWNGTNFVAPHGAAATVSARSSVAMAALVVVAVFGLVI
ncbi:hypothetical protein BKA62DRAFT_711381 [Auriculariales sp. MPI-PUGE-AT-0066]|nr:hypothetical protein BKA62DRAFT_711381 [Auriculariales sp. MPI-PUGE-AT-0066]